MGESESGPQTEWMGSGGGGHCMGRGVSELWCAVLKCARQAVAWEGRVASLRRGGVAHARQSSHRGGNSTTREMKPHSFASQARASIAEHFGGTCARSGTTTSARKLQARPGTADCLSHGDRYSPVCLPARHQDLFTHCSSVCGLQQHLDQVDTFSTSISSKAECDALRCLQGKLCASHTPLRYFEPWCPA